MILKYHEKSFLYGKNINEDKKCYVPDAVVDAEGVWVAQWNPLVEFKIFLFFIKNCFFS